MKTKISYGIALCRYNQEKNNNVEILLIKKRYSYQYQSFVMGHYNKKDIKYLRHLFNNMSFSEKIDILSGEFSSMWSRIWLNNPEKFFNLAEIYRNYNLKQYPVKDKFTEVEIHKLYHEKKNKFENNFLRDKNVSLQNLVQQSSNSEILWEIPKGRKDEVETKTISGEEHKRLSTTSTMRDAKHPETNLDCAIREFFEETSITSNKYKILYDVDPIVDSFIDNSTIYKTVYYIAKINDYSFEPRIDFKNFEQISEIEQIKWVSISEIKFFNLQSPIYNRLHQLFTRIIKIFKKKNRMYVLKVS